MKTNDSIIELKAEINRIIKDAFECGFDATNDHGFWFFDGPANAESAIDTFLLSLPNDLKEAKAEIDRLTHELESNVQELNSARDAVRNAYTEGQKRGYERGLLKEP